MFIEPKADEEVDDETDGQPDTAGIPELETEDDAA